MCTALVLALPAEITLAQDGGRGKVFIRMDRDDDGRISADEFKGPSRAFTAIDVNKDGFLTAEEMKAFRSGAGQTKEMASLREWYEELPVIMTHSHLDPRSGRGSNRNPSVGRDV